MKTLLAIFALVALIAIPAFGADSTYIGYKNEVADSFWLKKGDVHYTVHYVDTMTIHAKYGDTIIDLKTAIYNVRLKSINPAGDSGYIKVSLGRGIWHTDSVARNLSWRTRGLATGGAAPDTTWLYFGGIGMQYIYVRPVVGGTADSTTKIRVEGWR